MSFVTRNWYGFCLILGVTSIIADTFFGPSLFLKVCYLATLILAPAFIKSRGLVMICIACALVASATYAGMLFEPRIIHVTVDVNCLECKQ